MRLCGCYESQIQQRPLTAKTLTDFLAIDQLNAQILVFF